MRARFGVLLPLALLTAIFVPPALRAGWVLDDDLALARHAHHGEPCGEWTHSTYGRSAGIDGLLWRPLPAFVQHLLALAAGRTPEVFRLLNVALHALVVLAAMRVARRAGAGAGAAALVGCVLVLHPVVPEVVAWSSDCPVPLISHARRGGGPTPGAHIPSGATGSRAWDGG